MENHTSRNWIGTPICNVFIQWNSKFFSIFIEKVFFLPSVYLSVLLSFPLLVYLTDWPSIHPSVHLSACPSLHPPVAIHRQLVWNFVCLFACLFLRSFICLPFVQASLCVYIYTSLRLPKHLSVCLFVLPYVCLSIFQKIACNLPKKRYFLAKINWCYFRHFSN